MINFNTIKLIIWDLDETLWEGTLSDNNSIQINETFVNFINDSLDRGIVHSICSKNDYSLAKQYMSSHDLWDLFVFPSINWYSKGDRVKKIINDMNLREENTLFIDDNFSNLREAVYFCPQLQVCTPQQLMLEMDSVYEIETVNQSRPRLFQYRVLENKISAQQDFASNEDFLISCNICVDFHRDCAENIDRIHDLVMRSNQLNYTKLRQSKEDLLADLSLSSTQAAYITVKDIFGDYGIVGFYMITNGYVKHFLFSCRTLGMLVEQYVYIKIGCPSIIPVGNVVTELNSVDVPKWINQQNSSAFQQRSKHNTGDQKILFKGPCDISQIFSFIEQNNAITTEFTYTSDTGISVEGHNQTSHLITSLFATESDKAELISNAAWLDAKMLEASSWKQNEAIVFSLLCDGNLGVYQHKRTGWQISLCEKYYDLTDPKNWDDYINKKIFTSCINFTKDALIEFSKHYSFVDNNDGDLTITNLDLLYKSKRPGAKLILLLGSEKEYTGFSKPSYKNRHVFHKILNDKVKNWADEKPDVYLIEIGKYIVSQNDYLDTINHFQKRVYYRMAQDILSILGYDNSSLHVKRKSYVYWASIKRDISTFIRLIRKIIQRISKPGSRHS